MKGKFKILDKGFLLLLAIVVVIMASGLFLYFQIRTDRVTSQITKGENFGLHFMIRNGNDLLFSEVFFYNPRTGKGALVDIPGNLGSIIESIKRVDRIDILFKPQDTSSYRSIVEKLLAQQVSFYCLFSLDDVERFVDVLGGVEVFIANSIETDSKGNKVLLPSGNVHLDGGKVKAFLSFVDPEETEADRIGRIQKFIQGLLKRMGEEAAFLTQEDVFPFIWKAVKTDLDQRALQTFIKEMSKLDIDRMVFQRVLGTVRTVDNQNLLFPHFEGQLLKQTVKQIYGNLASTENLKSGDISSSVEILNGTKTAGLARRTREIFQSFGFEVISFSNAENTNVEKTKVIDRKGNPEVANKIAKIIRCTQVSSEAAPAGSASNADVTILLGKDFDGRYCK